MTDEDRAYADALDIFGSETSEPKIIEEILHALHDAAELSHRGEDGP